MITPKMTVEIVGQFKRTYDVPVGDVGDVIEYLDSTCQGNTAAAAAPAAPVRVTGTQNILEGLLPDTGPGAARRRGRDIEPRGRQIRADKAVEIAELIVKGHSNLDIAEFLHISKGTVSSIRTGKSWCQVTGFEPTILRKRTDVDRSHRGYLNRTRDGLADTRAIEVMKEVSSRINDKEKSRRQMMSKRMQGNQNGRKS